MIRSNDIDRLINQIEDDRESVANWCRRYDVDHAAMFRLMYVYGWNKTTALLALKAFRVGYHARQDDEPRGEQSARNPRYVVQFVVVDGTDGRIVGQPTSACDRIEGLAATYNELNIQPTDQS